MSESLHTAQTPSPAQTGHEADDLRLRPVVLSGLALVVVTVLVLLIMSALFHTFAARRAQHDVPPSPLAQARPPRPPEPHLQVNPRQELQDIRAAEETVLSSYGWVNPAEEVVRIPVARAIDLLVERGLPTRPISPAPRYEGTGR